MQMNNADHHYSQNNLGPVCLYSKIKWFCYFLVIERGGQLFGFIIRVVL